MSYLYFSYLYFDASFAQPQLDTTKHFLKRWSSKAGRYFCDCGKAFETVTELERHVLETKSR